MPHDRHCTVAIDDLIKLYVFIFGYYILVLLSIL